MKKKFVWDCETKYCVEDVKGGWSCPWNHGFGSAVVYSYDDDIYRFFGPDEKEECRNFLGDGLVVSFNGKKFDNFVIGGKDYNLPWEDLDLFDKIVCSKFNMKSIKEAEKKLGRAMYRGLGLGAISENTTGMKKSGSGANAPMLIKQKKFKEVFEYNLNDTRMTRRLYEFIQKNKFVIDGSGQKIEVNNKDLFG